MRREITFLINDEAAIQSALKWAEAMIRRGLLGGKVLMALGRERRNKDQNAKMWPMLEDLSKQVLWDGEFLTKDEWKDLITAALKNQKIVRGISGGIVVIGGHTSKFTKAEFSDLIEQIYSFGAEEDVTWSEKSKANFNELRGK